MSWKTTATRQQAKLKSPLCLCNLNIGIGQLHASETPGWYPFPFFFCSVLHLLVVVRLKTPQCSSKKQLSVGATLGNFERWLNTEQRRCQANQKPSSGKETPLAQGPKCSNTEKATNENWVLIKRVGILFNLYGNHRRKVQGSYC